VVYSFLKNQGAFGGGCFGFSVFNGLRNFQTPEIKN